MIPSTLIAGPCSAETREQVLKTAEGLSALPLDYYRAGIWKPRTRPGEFEGVGNTAIPWLQEVKSQFGLKISTEVAKAEHVESVLKAGFDMIWIGARSTANPFTVQEIADSLKGVNIPVMVKNPTNPDLKLWIGAIERVEKAGIKEISAIHRGFSGYSTAGGYRNQPNWPIPIELKRRKPELCIICDPSHITGNRNRIAELSQKALDMHLDGLMIETHPNPDAAWSDAAQQVTPDQLKTILAELVIREEHTHCMNGQEQLEHLRQTMDSMDAEIVDLIARRMELSGKIGAVKLANNMTVYQPARWREIVATRGERGLMQGLTKEFVVSVYEKIHQESIRIQLGDTTAENIDAQGEVKATE
jgi:chorismate mutase